MVNISQFAFGESYKYFNMVLLFYSIFLLKHMHLFILILTWFIITVYVGRNIEKKSINFFINVFNNIYLISFLKCFHQNKKLENEEKK